MALLLAMFQKMRLIREKNQATLELSQYTSKVDRIAKSIERVQKRYQSLFTQLESQAKMAQSQFTANLQSVYGLCGQGLSPFNYSGMGGTTMFAANMLSQWADSESKRNLLNAYQSGQLKLNDTKDGYVDAAGNNYTKEDYQGLSAAMAQIQQMQSYAQYQTQQMSAQYGNNVSIWLENAKAQLEAEQDATLEPLNYEQTMLELSKSQTEAKLQRINANLESYNQLCSQEAQNSAPSFGLS